MVVDGKSETGVANLEALRLGDAEFLLAEFLVVEIINWVIRVALVLITQLRQA